MVNEEHFAHRDLLIRDIIAKMRPDGRGGRAGKAELLTGSKCRAAIEGASSRPCAQDPTDQRLK